MPGINQLLWPTEKEGKVKVDKKADGYLKYFKGIFSGDTKGSGHHRTPSNGSTKAFSIGHSRNSSNGHARNNSNGHSRNNSSSGHSRNSSSDSTKLKSEESMPAVDMTATFYDLATDFYEYGWGESFHFYQIKKGETFDHALGKMQYKLALKLGIQPKDKILDIGCGVGGPARNIASFSDANVTGLNYNKYQVQRCRDLTRKAQLEHLCNFVQGDFNKMQFEDESFNHAYAIEATCHSDDKLKVYGEAFRVLKPGGKFAFYEWLMTDKYDPNNKQHRQIKHDIMEGNALPVLEQEDDVRRYLIQVGFEIVEMTDVAGLSDIPWYSALETRWTISNFRMTPPGRFLTHMMVSGLEMLGLAPRGSIKVHKTLLKAADALVKGGKEDIFTPDFLCVVRKPVE